MQLKGGTLVRLINDDHINPNCTKGLSLRENPVCAYSLQEYHSWRNSHMTVYDTCAFFFIKIFQNFREICFTHVLGDFNPVRICHICVFSHTNLFNNSIANDLLFFSKLSDPLRKLIPSECYVCDCGRFCNFFPTTHFLACCGQRELP